MLWHDNRWVRQTASCVFLMNYLVLLANRLEEKTHLASEGRKRQIFIRRSLPSSV